MNETMRKMWRRVASLWKSGGKEQSEGRPEVEADETPESPEVKGEKRKKAGSASEGEGERGEVSPEHGSPAEGPGGADREEAVSGVAEIGAVSGESETGEAETGPGPEERRADSGTGRDGFLAYRDSRAEAPASSAGRAAVIAIANQKGGVGKTTTAINLGASLSEAGKRVLLVDMDPQGNATSGVGIERANIEKCVYDVLVNEEDVGEVMTDGPVNGLRVIPSTINLAGAEVELTSEFSREMRLRRAIDPLREYYDYILIDCPPSLSLLAVNGLAAADEVLIPIQCEYYALEGLIFLMRTIQRIKTHLNNQLEVAGILMTMHDSRTNLSRQVIEEVRGQYPELTYETVIPRTVRLSEAPSFGKPILQYDSSSKGAEAYRELAKEVMQIGEARTGKRAGSVDKLVGRGGGEPDGGSTDRGDQTEPATASKEF